MPPLYEGKKILLWAGMLYLSGYGAKAWETEGMIMALLDKVGKDQKDANAALERIKVIKEALRHEGDPERRAALQQELAKLMMAGTFN